MRRIEPGSIVVYTRAFLQYTGQTLGDAPFLEGLVEELVPVAGTEFLLVRWSDDSDRTVLVRPSNVCLKGSLDSFEVR